MSPEAPPAPSNSDFLQELRALRAEMRELSQRVGEPASPGVTVEEACRLLGDASPSTVYRLLKAKKLQRLKSPGKKTLISRQSVLAYLDPPAVLPVLKPAPTRSGAQIEAAVAKLRP